MATWLKGLLQSLLSGIGTTGVSWMTLAGAAQIGLAVPILNWKALGAILVSSSVFNLFSYLKQSPLSASHVEITKTQITTQDVVKKDDV
jgi:hypothetical protein